MTYKEFKEMVEAAGVTDNCQIDSIGSEDSVDEVEVYFDKESNRCQIQPK